MGWTGGSLRGRLVLAFVAVAVLAAVLIGVITLSLIRLLPERNLEQQLADQAQAVGDTGAVPRPGRQLCALARVLRRGETEVYLLDADATPRRLAGPCQAPNRRGPIAPAPDSDLSAALAQGRVVTGTDDGLAWAVVPAERPVLRAGGGVLLVHEVRRLGLSLLPVVAWRLLLATALAVAVAVLAAWLLAGRLIAPLGRLVTAARRVGEGDLSTKVHVDGDGEVAEVATAFNDMAAGLERAQTEQRAFLASVGHEIKTPLTTVQGYTEAMLDGTVDDPAEHRRSLLRVHAETIRLARLVQVAARPLDDGGVEAAIVDQGPGIAADDLPNAFDRGYLWSRYRGTREVGSGLGLAIVKALCDAMGVVIRAESGPGGGTAFGLTLPPPRPPQTNRRPRGGPPSQVPNSRSTTEVPPYSRNSSAPSTSR